MKMPTKKITDAVRADFPALRSGVAYLDNAATTLKPQQMIDAITEYYSDYPANVHRGIYAMSENATAHFEAARETAQQFINAAAPEEIIFTSGTTHSINLVARLLAQRCERGDEIILSTIEHHANILPWQLIAQERGLKLQYLQTTTDHLIDPQQLTTLITPRTKILSISHRSNVTGYTPPVQDLIRISHEHDLLVVVDGAQQVAHERVNVQELDADFYVFSGHKICGPTGVGVLYGKRTLLESLQPVFGGGHMIDEVHQDHSTYAPLPTKFEPGTPPIASAIGMGAAITYLNTLGMDNIHTRVSELTQYALNKLQTIHGLTLYGPTDYAQRSGILSFTLDGVHPHDVASVLDHHNVAVRAGHHCAQLLLRSWGVNATTRVSIYFYNTTTDIDRLVDGIADAQHLLGKQQK